MSTIGNRFYVTALEDGTTLHGNLVSVGSLTQGWVKESGVAVPNWKTETATQPIIYLTLLSGNSNVNPDSNNQKWYYNDVELTFGSNGKSTNTGLVDVFQRMTYPENDPNGAPALKIIDNLASSSNVDLDTIRFSGQYTSSGAVLDFSATIQVRITSMAAGSYLGVIEFQNGISNITEKGQTITMYGRLYNSDGNEILSPRPQTRWFVNDQIKQERASAYTFSVTEGDIVDHAVIRCDFFVDADQYAEYSAYAAIDDMQDPEFLYIQYNGENGNAASLRKNEQATFQFWVGTRDSSDVLGGVTTPTYSVIKVKLLDGNGDVIMNTGLATQIPNPDTNGWRDLTNTMSGGKAILTPHYDTVNGVGKKNLTGIVLASEATSSNV